MRQLVNSMPNKRIKSGIAFKYTMRVCCSDGG